MILQRVTCRTTYNMQRPACERYVHNEQQTLQMQYIGSHTSRVPEFWDLGMNREEQGGVM